MFKNEKHSSNRISEFYDLSYIGHQLVEMPPDWKSCKKNTYTLFFVDKELLPNEYYSFFKKAKKLGFNNPRIFTPRVIEYASLFHPSFFYSLSHADYVTPCPLYDFIVS